MKTRLFRIILSAVIAVALAFPVSAPAGQSAAGGDANLDYLKSVMDMIKEKYKGEITDKKLIEGAIKGMFGTMDPYTVFFDPDEANSFLTEIEGSYEGVGIMIEKTSDYVMVLKVFSGSPAETSGILPGDKIAEVEGKNMAGASTEEISKLIKGKSGTSVKLGIVRSGENNMIVLDVKRAAIVINPVTYRTIGDTGYIKIDMFNANTYDCLKKALDEMDGKGIKKIVLDLRDNPGGEAGQAVSVAGEFVPEGLVTKLTFSPGVSQDMEYYSHLKTKKYQLAVLVNKMSASASEILAGAIQDTGAGKLIGTKTFGKAKVQNLFPILSPEAYKKYEDRLGVKIASANDLYKYGITPSDSEIIGWTKITTGMYTTPKGRMIDGQGLTPDIAADDPAPLNGINVNSIQMLPRKAKPSLNGSGVDVFNGEKILKALGYDIGTPDTRLDERTFKAIEKFQRDSGLYPYGVLDFTTQQKLNDRLESLLEENDKQYAKALEVLKTSP